MYTDAVLLGNDTSHEYPLFSRIGYSNKGGSTVGDKYRSFANVLRHYIYCAVIYTVASSSARVPCEDRQ